MHVIENEQILCVDIDDTLILWKFSGEPDFMVNDVPVKIHKKHIEQIKRFKARNQLVIAWSKGGSLWCEQAIKLLELEPYIDYVMCKPQWIIDDQPISRLAERIYENVPYAPTIVIENTDPNK